MIGKSEIIRVAGQVNLNPHVVEVDGLDAFSADSG